MTSSDTLTLFSQVITNTTAVGTFAQLAAYIGAIILGRWTVVIASVNQLHSKRLEIGVAEMTSRTKAKQQALVQILEETTQSFHYRLRLLRYGIFLNCLSVLLIIIAAILNGFSPFSTVPGAIARPMLVGSIVFLLAGLVLLFCEILYSVGPEKLASRKIVGLAKEEIPVNVCAAINELERADQQTALERRLQKRYRRSIRKRSLSREPEYSAKRPFVQ